MPSVRTLRRALRIAVLLAVLAWTAGPAVAEEPAAEAATGESAAAPAEQPEPPTDIDVELVDLEELTKQRMIVAMRDPLRPRVSRYLSKAAEEVEEGRPEEAERLLLKIQSGRLNKLESAYVYRMLGFVAYGDGRGETAIEYFQKALDQKAVQPREESSIRYGIAQLYMTTEEWAKAIEWFRSWLRYTPEPDPNGYYIMAIAAFQLQDYDAAIAYTKKTIEVAPPPQEAWLRLLSALYAQNEDYAKATPVLEELVLRFPKKDYWVQLSLIYAAREDYPISLAVQQFAYAQGLLTEEKELLRLARSYLHQELPYPAAQLMAREIESGRIEGTPDTYELIANSWIAAREYERALPPLQLAADLAPDGSLYVRLGQVHMQREEWGTAAKMLQKALDKGSLEKVGNAQLLLGIALYNDARPGPARNSFERARQHAATRDEAERWITHISRETTSQTGG